MKKIFSSVDIGSSTVKIVVLELFNGKLNVLASLIFPSLGIKNGVVVDEEAFSKILKQAFKDVSKSLGVKIDKALINVPMIDAKYEKVTGEIKVKTKDGIVTGDELVEVLEKSLDGKIDKTRELVTIMPIKYNIDGVRQDIMKPKGLKTNKLGVTAMCVTVPKKNIYKIISIFHNLGIEVIDILFGAIGDYYEFKNENTDRSVVGVINVGRDKTELSIFNKGIITSSIVLSYGDREIDNEISYVYNIKKTQAKQIKETFALGHSDFASSSDIYEITNKSDIKTKINQLEVSELVMVRLKEILENSKKDLNHLTKKEISYIIVTGGITNIPGFDILCKEVFKEKARIKTVNMIGVRNNSYSSSVGMIKYFINKLGIRGKEYSMFNEEEQLELMESRKNIQSSMFGKLFDYLFENKED